MRVAFAVFCLAAAACSTPCEHPTISSGLTVTSVVATPLTTPRVTACIDSFCDIVTVTSPGTSALPSAHGSVGLSARPGGTLVTLHFDDAELATDGGLGDAGSGDGGADAGHAEDGASVYLAVFEPTYGRTVVERAAPVPPRPTAGTCGWGMSL